ncbi:MAG: tetratricopeptide repeat protein, partial [Pirellulales bacterium]
KARQTVDRYFTLVSEDKLLDVPGLQPLRKDLLESALEFYKNVTVERPDDPALLADLAVTYMRLGHIYFALDRVDEATTAAVQALDAIARLERDPEAAKYEEKLAGSWKGWRATHLNLEMPRDPVRTFQTLLRLEATWKRLADTHPANAAIQVDLGSMEWMIGIYLVKVNRRGDAIPLLRKAVAIFERLSHNNPEVHQYRGNLASVSRELAHDLWKVGNIDEARVLIRRAIQLADVLVRECPDVSEYRGALAIYLRELAEQIDVDQPREAETSIDRAVDIAESLVQDYPGAALYRELQCDTLLQLAKMLAKAGQVKEAEDACRRGIAVCQPLVAEFPQKAVVRDLYNSLLSILAEQLVARGQQEEARDVYRKVVAFEPQTPNDYSKRADVFIRLNEPDKALADFNRAIELEPETPSFYAERATFFFGQHRYPEAIADWTRQLELDPDGAEIMNKVAWYLATLPDPQLRDPRRAVALAENAVEMAPETGSFWNTLGAAYYRAGDSTAAVNALNKSMELASGGNSFDWFFLAMAHWKLDEKDVARNWYDRAVEWTEKNGRENQELIRFRAETEKLLGIAEQPPATAADKAQSSQPATQP